MRDPCIAGPVARRRDQLPGIIKVSILIHVVDIPELVQKLRVTIVEAHDLPELRLVTRFVLYNFPPDFDLAEQ